MNEMRLIVIPTIQSDTNPVDLRFSVHGFQNTLKSADAAERLRRESNLIGEQFDESSLAKTNLFHNFANADFVRNSAELLFNRGRLQIDRLR